MTIANDASVIEFKNVYKRFGNEVAVENLSFSVRRGEILALLGRTGAGKSTVMNMLMGSMPCDEGSIRVIDVDPHAEFESLRGKMAVSFQTDRLLPWRNAEENVALGLILLGRSKSQALDTAREWLARVKLAGVGKKYVHELSGGMRQRVSLARALAVDPELVLLDESFSQLDHATSQELRSDFSELVRELGKTCVFVTHNIEDALETADRALVLTAPARVFLELQSNAAERADPERMSMLYRQVAQALGDDKLPTAAPAAAAPAS